MDTFCDARHSGGTPRAGDARLHPSNVLKAARPRRAPTSACWHVFGSLIRQAPERDRSRCDRPDFLPLAIAGAETFGRPSDQRCLMRLVSRPTRRIINKQHTAAAML